MCVEDQYQKIMQSAAERSGERPIDFADKAQIDVSLYLLAVEPIGCLEEAI